MNREIKKVKDIAYHRNGVGGIGFHVITFRSMDGDDMVATVFPEDGAVAVLDIDLLAGGEIRFAHNSWRGDRFEPELREAIRLRDIELYGESELTADA